MMKLSWKVFSLTGDLDTYVLLKELERDTDQYDQYETISEREQASTLLEDG